jgi:HEPN domain-containing protein
MTEFTKLKISYALALLGTLFALHPFLDRYLNRGFDYLGLDLKILYAYAATSGLLSLCVYLYAVTLMSDRPHTWCERAGNSTYSLAILIPPIYAGLFLSAKLADRVAVSHVAWAAPAVAVGLGAGWVALSQVVAYWIRRKLGDQDRLAKIAQLAVREMESLKQASEMFISEHYDLSVVLAWRALEARLRQALLSRRIQARGDDATRLLHLATRKGILGEPVLGVVEELRRHWIAALSTEPLSREAATQSLSAVRHILAVVPAHQSDRIEG